MIIVIYLSAQPTANNVTILNEFNLANGNTVLILAEVLFVTEAVVSRLHQVCFFNDLKYRNVMFVSILARESSLKYRFLGFAFFFC